MEKASEHTEPGHERASEKKKLLNAVYKRLYAEGIACMKLEMRKLLK
jgi:hypothetical protein